MPRGFTGVRAASDDISARKSAGGSGSGRKWFKLNDRESAVVRFLEEGEEVNFAWMHKLPATGERAFGGWVVCRDQDENGERYGEECPACDRELKRSFQGVINLIWRDAPVFETDSDGKRVKDRAGDYVVSGYEDQVAVWQTGITVFEELNGLDLAYKGLTSRDFRVTRKGLKLQTKYDIFPADPDGGKQALSASDKKLVEEKYNLEEDVVIPSLSGFWDNKYSSKKDEGVSSVREIDSDSPFRRRS